MGSLFRVFQARGGRFDLALLVTIAVFAGCTTGFEDPAFQQAQSAKLSSEVQAVSGTNTGRGRLFYIGLALFSQKWSENDVVDLATVLRRVSDYDVVSLIASNAIPSLPETYPIADDSAIEALVRTAADAAKDSDLIFVYISTHGTRGALTRKVGVFPEQSLSANGLAELLQPLVGHRTVIFLSACYSGSLLDQLKSDDRIVVTASPVGSPVVRMQTCCAAHLFREGGPAQLRTSRTELEADRARYHGGRSCPGASQQEYGFGTTGLRGTTHDEILHRTGILTPVIRTRRNAN